VDLIAARGTAGEVGTAPDLSRIDFQDEVLYDRICSGDTVGLFQIESRAQIQMLRRTRPRNLEDLAVQVAIVRPGPIVGGAVNPYVRRREMLREQPGYQVPYPHPLLEQALGETLGVIIFQDQVLKVCQDLASFSDGQAESLRRAMSRKRSKEALEAHWEDFRKGATANGVDEMTAREVFARVTAFSEFGFPKSHAVAFALLAYQSAWLRHHHPVEFYVALFNNQPMGFYSLDALGRDARRNGIKTLLPDVNRSAVACTAEGDDLRIGLGFVCDWGSEIAERVVREREARGPYRSLVDFLRRTPAALKRPAIENLIWVGGCAAFGLTRRELLWQTGLWLGPETDAERTGGRDDHAQTELGLDDPYAALRFPDLGATDRMIAEYRMLRFSAELHPLTLLAGVLPRGTVSSKQLPDLPQGNTVRVAGLVTTRQRPQTAKGFVFVLMEDEHGPINVIVKPDIYQRDRSAVRMEPFLAVRGKLQKDGATLNVIAHEVEALRVPGVPVQRRGLARTHAAAASPAAATAAARERAAEEYASDARAPAHDDAHDLAALPTALPDAQEYWAEPAEIAVATAHDSSAFNYLTALRQSPPGIKNFG
jgi:error-prone DNA polymerase